MVRNWGTLGSLSSWAKYEGNMKGLGIVGEEWVSVLGCGGGVGNVGKYEELLKSVWGECGGFGEVGESVLG